MAAMNYGSWPKFLWMPILSVIFPLAFVHFIDGGRKITQRIQNSRETSENIENIELTTQYSTENPIHLNSYRLEVGGNTSKG